MNVKVGYKIRMSKVQLDYIESDDDLEDMLYRVGEKVAQRARVNAPKPTGALKESISTTTRNRSDYGERAMRAQKLRPEIILGSAPRADNQKEVLVGTTVPYSLHVEFGTLHRPSKPYLIPAADGYQKDFQNEYNKYFNRRGRMVTIAEEKPKTIGTISLLVKMLRRGG